jgi:hypothetical protein
VLVEVAAREFRLEGREPSDSRISLLTGVHRKDVRAIRDHGAPLSRPAAAAWPQPCLAAGWQGGDDGCRGPPPHPARSAPAGTASFEALVASVSTDLRPRTVLDELLRLGLVTLDEEADSVRLLSDGYLPAGGSAEALDFFGRNLHDHMAAGVANLLAAPASGATWSARSTMAASPRPMWTRWRRRPGPWRSRRCAT